MSKLIKMLRFYASRKVSDQNFLVQPTRTHTFYTYIYIPEEDVYVLNKLDTKFFTPTC